jgi:short-subunit dehydrogenase
MINILITGCGSGLGKCLAKNTNHNIFCHFRTTEYPGSNILVGDINKLDFADRIDAFIRGNKISVFINNAGVYKKGSILDISDSDIFEILHTNLVSQILILKRVYSFFKSNNSGLIININSLAGKTPSATEPVYCASKFGLQGFSKSLQLDAIGSGVNIVDLYLGAMKTRMTEDRKNHSNLINPEEISELIYNIIETNKSYYTNEIVVRRK